MILVSACLLGINCQYNKENDLTEKLLEFLKDKGKFVAVCPEVLGNMPVPRDGAAIIGGTGKDVIEGKAKVKTVKGDDVTDKFIKGAERTLKIAKENNIDLAILKAKSPSCGAGLIYNSTSFQELISGDGVAAALLRKNGIKVMTEKDLIANNWPK